MNESTLRERFSDNLGRIEVAIYSMLAVLLALTALVTIGSAGKMLWDALSRWSLPAQTLRVLNELLIVLMLVEILHTVRISIRSHILVTEPFLIVGLIATIRRILVITLNAANLTSTANWANDGPAKLRASMVELALLGATVIVLVISIHILRKSKSPEEEEETRRAEGRGSAQSG